MGVHISLQVLTTHCRNHTLMCSYDIFTSQLSDRCDFGVNQKPQCALEVQVLGVSCDSHRLS